MLLSMARVVLTSLGVTLTVVVPISSLCALVTPLAIVSLHDIPSAAGQEPPNPWWSTQRETFPFLFRLSGHSEMLSKGFSMSLASPAGW